MMVATSLVMVATSLVMVATSWVMVATFLVMVEKLVEKKCDLGTDRPTSDMVPVDVDGQICQFCSQGFVPCRKYGPKSGTAEN